MGFPVAHVNVFVLMTRTHYVCALCSCPGHQNLLLFLLEAWCMTFMHWGEEGSLSLACTLLQSRTPGVLSIAPEQESLPPPPLSSQVVSLASDWAVLPQWKHTDDQGATPALSICPLVVSARHSDQSFSRLVNLHIKVLLYSLLLFFARSISWICFIGL